jgi:hypothetical protein
VIHQDGGCCHERLDLWGAEVLGQTIHQYQKLGRLGTQGFEERRIDGWVILWGCALYRKLVIFVDWWVEERPRCHLLIFFSRISQNLLL